MIDITFSTKGIPENGSLLIADPFASDNYFTRSVVLLCNHDEDGSFGFVLNNYIDIELHQLLPGFPEVKTKVSIGGPVETDSIFFIHTIDSIEDGMDIGNGLKFGGTFSKMVEELTNNPSLINQVRFFMGYAGWSKNQLASEMESNGWIISKEYNVNELFQNFSINLWKEIMEKKGGKFKLMTDFPLDPTNN